LVGLHAGNYILPLQVRSHIEVSAAVVGIEKLVTNYRISCVAASLESPHLNSGNIISIEIFTNVGNNHTTKVSGNKLPCIFEAISRILSGNSCNRHSLVVTCSQPQVFRGVYIDCAKSGCHLGISPNTLAVVLAIAR